AGDRTQIFPPPTTKDPGTIYDGARGNPGWAAKFAMFDSAVRDMGWRYPAVEVAMDKLCYIDAGAEVNAYLAMMTALERDFPATRFVYLTMPLQSTAAMDASNMTAMNYNQVVRAHCAAPRRVLLDIADIESHDPAGNPITFTSGGDTYQRLWSGYTYDGGHLNAVGARRAALGWYAVAAAIVTDTSATPLPADPEAVAITSIAPNPVQAGTTIRFRLQRPGSVRLSLYDVRGREVAQLIDADLSAGDHVCHWDARDAGGRRLSAGMYFARLQGGAAAHSRRFALVE
ncbi:T9SS type A sorting domain-containing protein, partial [bacterium]|nr:T9SS type A sorting domain-containing protein [bacterium]